MTNNKNLSLDKRYFADKFYEARTKKGITVEDLAEEIGVTPRVVYSYQNGEKIPSVTTMVAVSSVLEISLDSMLRLA